MIEFYMEFNLGDWVICNDTHFNIKNEIGKVVETDYIDDKEYYAVDILGNDEVKQGVAFWRRELTLLPLINPLNKKLYPNRVEWKGYLIPKEAAEKLKEDV